MEKVFCIAAGLEQPKKDNSIINKKNRYLNYGLLSLVSLIHDVGVDTIQIQGDYNSALDTYNTACRLGLNETNYPILISIPSFYALSWANSFLSLFKKDNPERKIIIGGRWVIGNYPEKLNEVLSEKVDEIVSGIGEIKILQVLRKYIPYIGEEIEIKTPIISRLNFSLLHEYENYQPCIEVSRGCGKGCFFCQEAKEPLTKLKDPELIVKEIISLPHNFKITPYFQASMLAPSSSWIKKLIEMREKYETFFSWRTEARVDSITSKNISLLAAAGLKVLDIGLESASPIQLHNMNKHDKPEIYLKRASELLQACYKNNIKTKINILLYAGETLSTLDETIDWLNKHRKYITGVSVGPVIIFGWESDNKQYIKELETLGACLLPNTMKGLQYINLSEEISYQKAIELSKEISRQFMTKENYFDLKSFSYFDPTYTYGEFLVDVENSDKEKLSFL